MAAPLAFRSRHDAFIEPPRRSPNDRARQPRLLSHGFTLLELLIVLGVLAILAGIGAMALMQLRRQLAVESAANELSQDFGRARSRALSSGTSWRVRLTGPSSYVLEQEDEGDWELSSATAFPTLISITEPSPDAPGSEVIAVFDSRGFAQFQPAGLVVAISDGDKEISVAPAMTGTARIR